MHEVYGCLFLRTAAQNLRTCTRTHRMTSLCMVGKTLVYWQSSRFVGYTQIMLRITHSPGMPGIRASDNSYDVDWLTSKEKVFYLVTNQKLVTSSERHHRTLVYNAGGHASITSQIRKVWPWLHPSESQD